MTRPRLTSVRCLQPEAQCSHTLGTDTRSNGRERNRYAVPVSAPTGHICTVLPEKYELNGLPSAVPIIWPGPRSRKSMNGSPAISSEHLTHRVPQMQPSRSSSTPVEIGPGFSKVRFSSVNLVSPLPHAIPCFSTSH